MNSRRIELSGTGSRVRGAWAIPGVREPAPPSYRSWLRGHTATAEQLATQREWSEDPRLGREILVVVLPGAGDVAATVRSLAGQSHSRWTSCVVGAGESTDPRVRHAPLTGQLADTVNAWELKPDGSFVRLHPRGDEEPLDSQALLLEEGEI